MFLSLKSRLILCASLALTLASCAPPPGQSAGGAPEPAQFIMQTVWYFLLGLGVVWMLVLRPEQQKREEKEKFFKALAKGDRVSVAGGILGKVVSIKDDEVQVEVAQGVKLRVLPQAVAKIPENADGAADSEKNTQVTK
ncbi:MAG: preprotein translocase subunit YajC [bacterium]|nr:preprotein translocase subunit YajC [bacterium]